MADTTIFALVGSLALTLTVIPVLCVVGLRRGVKERTNHVFEWIRDRYASGLDWCLAHGRATIVASLVLFAVSLVHRVHARRRVHAEARRGRALGSRDDAVHDLVRGVVEDRAAGPRDPAELSLKSRSWRRSTGATTPAPTRQDSSMPSSMSG